MHIVIIIPTYNERENISLLIEALQHIFSDLPHEMSLLVVDDNSPDGTAAAVRQYMQSSRNIALLSGPRQGLGVAYIKGMHYALHTMHADAIMQMDADFSHRPQDVPRLIAALQDGADFVIGSRYIEGGSIPADWGILRRMLSKWGNVSIRYLTGLAAIRDCTAGFRAIRAPLLHKMDLRQLATRGYAFQIALLQQALRQSAVVREIPVAFVNRVRGATKLGVTDVCECLRYVWRMRRTKV